MRVGWLVDQADHTGGAELTQAEFRAAAPDNVEVIDCPAGEVVSGLDRYVIHNCVQYTLDDLHQIEAPTIKFWHDVGPHIQPAVREWLDANATVLCCSPAQADYMGIDPAGCVPPPVDLARFEQAAQAVNGDRTGAVSVGQWRNFGKAAHKAAEWAAGNGGIDFYGGGPFAPPGSQPVDYDAMPGLLARYRTFVFLPTVIEPFGRLVVEAWAAGCEIVTNNLVGAKWWIENRPDAIDTAADDFWELVLR